MADLGRTTYTRFPGTRGPPSECFPPAPVHMTGAESTSRRQPGLNAAHLPAAIPPPPLQGSGHKVLFTHLDLRQASVCLLGCNRSWLLGAAPPRLGDVGSREQRRQTQDPETEARAPPAYWSQSRPIKEKGRCHMRHIPSTPRVGGTANQHSLKVPGLTNRRSA